MPSCIYNVGVDVGESGIGITAFRVSDDKDQIPVKLLLSMVEIIDGAKDPSSGKTPQSRKLVSGVARRARRLARRRKKRIEKLGTLLDNLGITAGTKDLNAVTYEPWLARAELIKQKISDDSERNWKLRLAIIHIARHRGWRNPWWTYDTLALASTPTDQFEDLRRNAADYFQVSRESLPTLGTIGALAVSPAHPLRPRTADWSLAKKSGFSIINTRIFQEDQLAELRQILNTQGIPTDQADAICKQVFWSEKPRVKAELVGRCALDGSQFRAPRSSLEFQEFRIRATIGNLGLRKTKARLSADDRNLIIERLMEWREPVNPSWDEVAEWIGLEGSQLAIPSSEEASVSNAPVMSTVIALKNKKTHLKKLWNWWTNESTVEQRNQFAAWLGDASEAAEVDLIEDVVNGLSAEELSTLDGLTGLGTGRASYGRKTLATLNMAMKNSTGEFTDALKSEFNRDANWRPTAPSIFEPIDHPVVDQVATVVGRVLQDLVRQYGTPNRVHIEHVRGAFLSPTALQEYQNKLKGNRTRNSRDREHLEKHEKLQKVSKNDVRRHQLITMQNGKCLYCGAGIKFANCELDHIVPRRVGGSSKRENLVAVCKTCNADKGSKPFGLWAETSNKPGVSLSEARARLKEWQRPNGTSIKDFAALKRRVSVRLARKSHDEPIDERSLETTAYAAQEIRRRVEGFLELNPIVNEETGEVTESRVWVTSGSITSEARRASGIDRKIALRGLPSKSRLDRRHHAIDAAVVATLQPKVAQVLATRNEMRSLANENMSADERTLYADWRDYSGEAADEKYLYARWRKQTNALAELICAAVEHDRIVVRRPLRLGANVGLLHKATIEPFVKKSATEAFSSSEMLRIVDRDIFMAAHALVDSKSTLPALSDREKTGTELDDPNATIELHPGSESGPSARMSVRGGSVALGDTLHHARVYAVRGMSGKISYKILRVFAGEFALIGFKERGIDLFTQPLPEWSQAIRCADPGLLREIASGNAKQIGWLVPGDEIEFSTGADLIPPLLGFTVRDRLVPTTYETRWTVTGFEDNKRLNLKPSYLASEGLPEDAEPHEPLDKTVKIMGDKSWRANPDKVLQANPNILRRTSAGTIRWRSEQGLPYSWNVLNRTREVFDDDAVASS